MNPSIRLCLVLHNHQPIGNFGGVFEQAYYDSYLPFLDVFEPFTDLRISLHTSGPLMEWLDEHHGEYLDRLANLVQAGRIEIVGGPFYEPILTMIPPRDRVGQISDYTAWLENRLGATVKGMWVPERVWEQSLTADIAAAGIRYTVLDDFHFKNAGLTEDQLFGYYISEDDGRLLSIFPGSERLRYLIPFADPQESISYLRNIAERHPGSVAVFGDDGEKFGAWPETKKHVYENGWLRRFLEGLSSNREWINTTTLGEAVDNSVPTGKIYLPDSSYREMTEWALPTGQQQVYDDVVHQMREDSRWPALKTFMRGGYWRNFKVKYPEANEMYARMMMVSRRLAQAERDGRSRDELYFARRELYRGQCNCSYWHGAFGGIYLPHLRNAVYNHLIAADNLLDQVTGRTGPRVDAVVDDLNFDARQEVRLSSDKLSALIAPAAGGHIYELDVRSICLNLGATLTRRPEAYHRRVLAGLNQPLGNLASINDRVIFKQADLDQRVQYDRYPRKSLVDHFFDNHLTLEDLYRGKAEERGDFSTGVYEAKLRKNPDRIQVVMTREGAAFGQSVRLTKGVTLASGSNVLEIGYMLEGLPVGREIHFGVEFNFAGLPSGADDRYFYQGEHRRLGQLGTRLNLFDVLDLGLVDEWLGIDVRWTVDQPTNLWTYPVESVSQSEGGFELVHQSVVVVPHWHIRPDSEGRWMAKMQLHIDTSPAERRMEQTSHVAAS